MAFTSTNSQPQGWQTKYTGRVKKINQRKQMYCIDDLQCNGKPAFPGFVWLKWSKFDLEIDNLVGFEAKVIATPSKTGWKLVPTQVKVLVGNDPINLSNEIKKHKVGKVDWTTKTPDAKPLRTRYTA